MLFIGVNGKKIDYLVEDSIPRYHIRQKKRSRRVRPRPTPEAQEGVLKEAAASAQQPLHAEIAALRTPRA